jgi:hypothetical protein
MPSIIVCSASIKIGTYIHQQLMVPSGQSSGVAWDFATFFYVDKLVVSGARERDDDQRLRVMMVEQVHLQAELLSCATWRRPRHMHHQVPPARKLQQDLREMMEWINPVMEWQMSVIFIFIFIFIFLRQGPLIWGYFNLNMNEGWVWWV